MMIERAGENDDVDCVAIVYEYDSPQTCMNVLIEFAKMCPDHITSFQAAESLATLMVGMEGLTPDQIEALACIGGYLVKIGTISAMSEARPERLH